MMSQIVSILMIPLMLLGQGWFCLAHSHHQGVVESIDHDFRPHFHMGDNGHQHQHANHENSHVHDVTQSNKGSHSIEGSQFATIQPICDHDSDAVYCDPEEALAISQSKIVTKCNSTNCQPDGLGISSAPADDLGVIGSLGAYANLLAAHPQFPLFLRTLRIRC